jgi:hypothetical protein
MFSKIESLIYIIFFDIFANLLHIFKLLIKSLDRFNNSVSINITILL